MGQLPVARNGSRHFDVVALGEVMLRLDPGEGRISTTRQFRVCEGGGEYNVARALRRCFGLQTTIVTSLVDNQIGRLIEDLILQGGVDISHLRWLPFDGIGHAARNGLNFTERGFGLRAALGCSDRGHSAISQVGPGTFDWKQIFETEGTRWFHTGGIYAALSHQTAEVALEAMEAAHAVGAIVSYDLNFRPSLWQAAGGTAQAVAVNRSLVSTADVVFGNEEDYTAALGYDLATDAQTLAADAYEQMFRIAAADYPNVRAFVASLRRVKSASFNDWSGVCLIDGSYHVGRHLTDLLVLDRVGGGDSFASGFIYGLLADFEPTLALEYAIAHGALAMTTPGDTSMATLAEIERVVRGADPRVTR